MFFNGAGLIAQRFRAANQGREGAMLVGQHFVRVVSLFAILAGFALNVLAQPMLIDPAMVGRPADMGAAPATIDATSDNKRAENAEHLRIAMRKLDANGGSDSATAQEVAFYQTREALLTQQTAVEQQIKD